jgi:NADPH2:quinone reductase
MKAIEIREVGGPAVLQLVERPRPELTGPSDILVRILAAGVNPIDTKVRSRGPLIPDGLPAVLGCDGAGVVEAIGADVTRFKAGDEVWYCHGGVGGPVGNYSEYIVLDNHLAQAKPRGIGFAEAACAPLVVLTAWEALNDRARLTAGQTVLIHGGAGGVGHVAIQIAHFLGARVCTTVSSPEKADFARSLGAEYCIDYRKENMVDAVMDWTGGHGVDVALDTIGPDVFRSTIPVMAQYGDLVTILDPGPDLDLKEARMRNLRIGLELMLTPMLRDLPRARAHQGEILRRAGDMIDAGTLKIHCSRTFPLAEAQEAHKLIEAGHVSGKLALTIE